VISSDWMALMTTGAWADGCSKADWTCAVYVPVTLGATGACGYAPNSDTTFKPATGTNPFAPGTYTSSDSMATTVNSANAIFTQDGTTKAWKLTVSNQQSVRVDDSICVVCRVDGQGVYSSSSYLNLKALAPADVFYTTGLSDVSPSLSLAGVTVVPVL